ncbi:MAG: integrase family protein [Pseudomonadota bacterium]
MPWINMTKRAVEALPFPNSGQVIYRDKTQRGLGLRVGTQSKVYFAEGQTCKRTRRVTIGRADVLTPETARKRTLAILGEMAQGTDVVQERRRIEAEKLTMRDAKEAFFAAKSLAPSSVDGYQRTFDQYLKDWQTKPLSQITKQMVQSRHAKLSERHGGATANTAFRHFRSLYNFTAASFEDFAPNPVTVLSQTRAWNREQRRQSLVPASKLPSWWRAVHEQHNDTRDILIIALLTGMRRSEITSLQWRNIDFEARTLTLPKTKNGHPLELPLASYLLALLAARHSYICHRQWVFPSHSATGYIRETKKMTARVSEAIGHHFTMHDLRRTFITIAESLDIPHYALKRLLNHRTDGDVTGGYIVINAERLRDPVERVTERILEMADGEKE